MIISDREQKPTPGTTNKVYPGSGDDYELLSFKERPTPRDDLELIQYGKEEEDDQRIKAQLVGNKDQLNQWMVQFRQQKQGENKATSKQENESRLENIYSGMILLRRLTRLIVQFIFIGLVIGFFAWGYFVTVKNSSWSAGKATSNIDIYLGNCFVNVSQSENFLEFSFKAKGSMSQQVNGSEEFRIKGEILTDDKANLTFYDPNPDQRSCIIDLKLPKNIDNLNILCRYESICTMAFGQDELIVNQKLNASSEHKANLQINFRNLKTTTFIYYAESSGNLFLNNFELQQANIRILSGDVILQSTKSFFLNFSSQSHAICSSAYSISDLTKKNCYFDQSEKDNLKQTCEGQMTLCLENNQCDAQSQIVNIIGNSSTIYANLIQDIGKPLIEGVDQFQVIQSYPFQTGNLNFDQESVLKIQQFWNKSGSADVAVRLDVGGHYLLQHTYSTQWAFFSNPSYAAFQPWWLSAFSATFLNPMFTHIQVSTDPGLCPWNPALNAKQSLLIQDLIKRTFNTTYGEAIFIQKDNFVKQNETLNENLTYSGFDPLTEKQRGKYENWSIINNVANNIVYEPLHYDPFFIAAIALSLLSSLIFGAVCIFVLIVSLQGLESYVLETSAQFQNYSATTTQTTKDSLASVAKKMLQKLEQLASKKDPPILLGVLSYVFYSYGQSTLKSAPKMFCKTIFKKSNEEQTAQFYKGILDKDFLKIDEEDLKEQYEQFCFLNKLTIEPLSQQEQLLEQYGFEIAEKDDVLILSKIKMNPNAKPYQDLTDEEKTSGNSLELFMATQCLLTGVPADILASDKLEAAYLKFCGKTLKVEQFNVKDISNDFGLLISDLKAFELRQVKSVSQQRQSWYTRFLGKCTHYIPFMEDYYLEQPVFILRKNTEISKFQQNPIKTMGAKQLNANLLYYNAPFMFIQSLVFNYKTRLFNRQYSYREKEDKNVIMDYFDALYMNGWILSDIVVVFGNFIVTAVTIIPMLYFIIIINTSYSPFSIYDPKNLLFMDDALSRPWTITDYFGVLDYWVLVLGILLAYYSIITFLFQSVKYLLSYFPDEVGYMWEFKLYQNRFMKLFNWFQWIQFLILAFSVFFYFGLIIVWLLLGAIINPNFYLVYSSAALSLVSFIAAQISQLKSTYEQACAEIKKIINEVYLRTFGQLAGAIIKEVQKLTDLSTTIINSTNMDAAKDMATNLGFGEELNELCILTQGMIDNAGSTDLNADQINFKQIKDKFMEKACEKFVKIAKDQFEVPEIIAEQLVKANFVKFDELIDPLANQIQIQSQNKIPAAIVKWIYQTSVKLARIFSKKTPEEQRKEMQIQLPIISVFLLDAVIDGIMLQTQIDDKGASQQAFKSVLQSLFNLMMDHTPKNILKQVKKLFENIKDFVAIDSAPLQALEIIFDFAQQLSEGSNVEEAKQTLIKKLLSLFNIDQDIASVFQLLFSKQQSLFVEKDIQLTPTEQAGIIIRLSDKYLIKGDIDPLVKQKFEVFLVFAMKFLKNDKPPLSDLVKLIAAIYPGQEQENEEYFEKLLESNYGVLNAGFSLLQLSIKNWKQELPISQTGKNLELVFDVLYVSSKFIWSSSIIDKQNQESEHQVNPNATWSEQLFSKPATQIVLRKDKLNNRDIIELMSLAFQISENAVIGLILVLRGDINYTIYHESIYQELLKIVAKNTDSQISELRFVMELLSITNFEDILFYLCQFNEVYKKLIEKLLSIIFSSRTMFRVFNGYLVIEKIIDKSLKEQNGIDESALKNYFAMAKLQIFGKEFEDQAQSDNRKREINQIWNNDQKYRYEQTGSEIRNEIEDQLVNYYKSERITFFTFLKKSQRDEQNNKQEKTEFLSSLSSQQQLKLEYLYMLLEQQQGVSANNTLNSPLLNGLKAEALKNLLVLITFKDAASVGKALKYFINYHPQAYESIDLNKVQIELQKIIDVEQIIASFQLPNTIPYQFQKLLNLFVNQIFYTKIPISSSIYSDLFNYLKFEVDGIRIQSQDQKKTYEMAPLFVSNSQKDGAFANIKKLIPFSEKFIRMMFNSNVVLRDQAILQVLQVLHQPPQEKGEKDAYNSQISELQQFVSGMMDKNYETVLSFLIRFCNCIQEKKFRKFFKKVIDIVRGFVTIEPVKRGDASTKQLIWATQQLKYFMSSDLDAFMELLQIYFNTALSAEKPNNNVIKGLFSLMTPKPDYELLSNIFDLDEEALKFGYFLVQSIFSESKSKILSDPKVHKLIEKNFGIKDFNPLIDLSDILESNSMDSKTLIIKLKLEQNPIASKLFRTLFAFKRQMVAGDSWKQLQDNYNLLAEQRAEIFKQDKDNKKQQQGIELSLPDTLEVLHWFSNPRPTSMLYLLNKIPILDQQEPSAIFIAAVGAIGKYDRFDSYLEKQPEKIRNRADTLQKLSQKSVDKALLFIAQSSDQDLQEGFSMLQLVTGINPVLISAIFNTSIKNNACLEQILQTETTNNQNIIKLLLNRFDAYEKSNFSAINRLQIIEYETLKNTQSDQLPKVRDSYLKKLNVSENDYQVVERFLLTTSKGKLAQSFPLSSIILIYALKHIRETRKSKDLPFAQYVKGQYCLNIAFTVFEKYLYFFDNKNLSNLNKPALVKLLTVGIFDTTKMRSSEHQINYSKLEGMLYPGLSDPFLEVKGSPASFLQLKSDNQAELAQNLLEKYEDYCKIFYRILPQNQGEEAENREEFANYDQLWCQFFTGKVQIQNTAVIYQSSKSKQEKQEQKDYYEGLSKAAAGPKLQLQYMLVAKLSILNITQYGFIRSKYWDKSMEFLKKQIFKPSEIEVLESDQSSEQVQQIMIALLQYYAGQFTVQQVTLEGQNQKQQKQNQTNSNCFEPLMQQVQGQKQRAQPKFRGSKSKTPINLNVLIDNLLGMALNETERKELKPIVDLFYNPKSMDTEFISKTWGNDKVVMDAILMMLIRVQLEQAKASGKFSQFAKKVPACYLYYSLGDQYENLSKEDVIQYKKNSDQMNQGIDELIQDCNEIQPSIKAPLKLMIRCYLGDVEAWYALIAFSRKQDTVDTEYLSERMIRTFIIELLLQFKNTGLRSPNIERQQLASQTFGQVLKQQGNQSLIKIVETSLMNTFAKDNENFPVQTVSKLMQFLGFVFEGKTEVLADQQNSGFIDIMVSVLNISKESAHQNKLINVIQFILQLLFKGDKSNTNFSTFEKNIQLSNENQIAWEFTKAIIEVDHSKDINVLILKAYQILEQNQMHQYLKYLNLLVSLSSIIHVELYPTSGIEDKKIISVMLYPIIWLGSQLEDVKEPISEFKQQCEDYLQQLPSFQNDFMELLNQFYTLSNKENKSQSAVTDQNVEFYKKAFQNWCQSTNQNALQKFFGFMQKDVLNTQVFPSSIKVLIDTLIALIFNQKLNQDPDQKLLKQLIDELTKIDPLDKQKDVIKAIIIMFSGLSDAKDIKGQKFLDAINTLLSKHNSEVGDIVKIIFAFYQSENIDSLKELPLKIQKGCFNSDAVYKSKFDNLPLAQLFQIASNAQLMIKKLEDSKQINETELLQMVKPVLEPMFGQKQDKELNILIKCIEAIIAIKNQKFNEVTSEFFQVMKISQSNSQLLIGLMKDFQLGLKSPQQLIKEKMASLVNPNTVRTMQYMNSVMTKLNDNRELQYEDMFRVLDKHGQRQVKASDVIEFLRRINIEITEHKFREVIVTIKGDQVNLQTCMIDFYEFKEIMQEISVQTMFLSLEYLGISKPLLIKGLVVLILYLVVVLAFILIGVQAFAIPGTFAAIVNAALPMIGGFGLNKQAAEEKLKALNLTAILDVVKKAIKVIQSRRI